MRGVPEFESVAEHSQGVALITLMLCELVGEPLDRAKALSMAVLHDLPESVTGDLSLGASSLLPTGAKAHAEQQALAGLLENVAFAPSWQGTWQEFEAHDCPEARLVRDADRLDLLTQALVYERTTGTVELDEFWRFAPPESFSLPISREVARALAARRPRARNLADDAEGFDDTTE